MPLTAQQILIAVSATGVKQTKDELAGITQESKGASGGVGGFLSTMAGFAGGAAVVNIAGSAFGFLKGQVADAWESGKDANSVMAQLTAGLQSTHDASGMTAQSLSDLADHIMNVTGISDDAVKTSEAMLLTFTSLHKDVYPAVTQAAADMATKFNGGITPSAQQMQQQALLLGKALNDPKQGLTALTREGVTFSDQQKEQITHMMKVGDTAGAQKLMLQELNKEFGGSAEAAGKANGGLGILAAQFGSMKEQLGQEFIPIMSQVLGALQPLIAMFQAQLPGAMKFVSGFVSGTLLPAIANFSSWIKTDGVPDITKLATYFQENLLPPIQQVASFVTTTLIPAVVNVGQHIGAFMGYVATHQDAMNAFKAILAGVAVVIAVALVASFVAWAIAAGAAAIATIAATWPILAVGAGIALLIFGIKELISHWGDISAFFGNLKNAIGDFFSNMGTTMHNLGANFLQAGKDMIQHLIDGIKSMAGNIGSALSSTVHNALANIPGIGMLLPHFAAGGIMDMSGLALVGENGPELLALPGGSRVFSNRQTSSMLSSGFSGGSASYGSASASGGSGLSGAVVLSPGTPLVINIGGQNVATVLWPELVRAARTLGGAKF